MRDIADAKKHRSILRDDEDELRAVLASLARENSQLKQLVVRLSETVLRNVTAKL
jgi:hypothetical protein